MTNGDCQSEVNWVHSGTATPLRDKRERSTPLNRHSRPRFPTGEPKIERGETLYTHKQAKTQEPGMLHTHKHTNIVNTLSRSSATGSTHHQMWVNRKLLAKAAQSNPFLFVQTCLSRNEATKSTVAPYPSHTQVNMRERK